MQLEQGFHRKTELGEFEARFRVPAMRNIFHLRRSTFICTKTKDSKLGAYHPTFEQSQLEPLNMSWLLK